MLQQPSTLSLRTGSNIAQAAFFPCAALAAEEASSSTQVDSAKDIESGRPTTEDDKLLLAPLPPPPHVQQAALGIQQRSPALGPSAFGSQLYKQLGSGGGSREVNPGASGGAKKGGCWGSGSSFCCFSNPQLTY